MFAGVVKRPIANFKGANIPSYMAALAIAIDKVADLSGQLLSNHFLFLRLDPLELMNLRLQLIVEFNVLLYLTKQLFYNPLVWRFFVELQSKDPLKR